MPDAVTLIRQDCEDLIDSRGAAVALRAVATGAMDMPGEAELGAFLAAPTPLAFWRARRGLTQAELARTAGLSRPYLAQIEAGKRVGAVRL